MDFDPRPVLRTDFPELKLERVEELGEGWDHVAYLVNGEYVFRLPWAIVEGPESGEPEPSASGEIALLEAVAGKLSVAVPEPVFVAPGERYFGYRFLRGTPVDQVTAAGLPRNDLLAAVVDVALEVEQLVPVDVAVRAGLPLQNRLPNDLSTARAALDGDQLTAPMRRAAEVALDSLERRWERAAATRIVTMHADFGLDHWLLDDEGDVYALIDWTDACAAPAENHISALMWHVPDLAADAADLYEERTRHELDRVLIFANGYANALGDLVELIEEDEPDEEVDWCLRFLRNWSDPRLMATLGVEP